MEWTVQLYTAYNRMRERIIFSVVLGQVCLTTAFLRPYEIVITVVIVLSIRHPGWPYAQLPNGLDMRDCTARWRLS